MSERIYQIIIGVLVLVILVGGWLMIAGKRQRLAMGSESAATSSDMVVSANMAAGVDVSSSASATVSDGSDAVSAVDQPAGKTVSVQSVTADKRSWVAVRDSNNWVLGAGIVAAGTTKNVTVSLLRDTKAGDTYQVVVYVDNGDGVFELSKDTLVTKADGSALSATFVAK